MKELSIEEKAKAYDEALERAKQLPKISVAYDRFTIERIFPELSESEDEKIRKALVRFHKSTIDVDGIKGEEIVAWLEKQGEKKATDKVEPKFHEGDWVVYKNDICQIVKREEGCNKLVTVFGIEKELVNERNLSTARLWTIQDAKPGDVLYSLDSKQPFIFKHRKPNEQAAAYCGLNIYGKFFVWGTKDCVITLSNYVPATKEQHDILFQKMKEEGYQWDADTKKLINTTILEVAPQDKVPTSLDVYYAVNNIKSLEVKISVLTDEILVLKERVKALEIQAIRQCSDKAGDNITLKDMKS